MAMQSAAQLLLQEALASSASGPMVATAPVEILSRNRAVISLMGGSLSAGGHAEILATFEKANVELEQLLISSESGIALLAKGFALLAAHTETFSHQAGAIVGCVESESISAVLPKVQSLGAAVKEFIGKRLQATTGILQTVSKEVELLRQLSRVTSGQTTIALKTRALSLLTNIEVARLGSLGWFRMSGR